MQMKLAEGTATGTYTVAVSWSGGRTYEVEADSEQEAIDLAIDKAETGDMGDSEISRAEIEDFCPDPESCPDPDAAPAAVWADRVVREFIASGLPFTPLAGEACEQFGEVPRAVLMEVRRKQGVVLEERDGTTYLVLVPASEPAVS